MYFYLESAINETKLASKTGIYLVVHNQSSSPYTLTSGITIQTGFETYIGIQKQFTNKLPSPYSDCLMDFNYDNNYAQKIFSLFKELNVTNYDQKFCFTLCYQDKLINRCNCSDTSTPTIYNASFCVSESENKCLNAFDTIFSTRVDLNNVCKSACPQQCFTSEYNLMTTMATFPTLNYLKYLQSNEKNLKFFPQNFC